VDNLWISACVADRLHFFTSLFHSGAGATTSLGHFSTLAQERAKVLFVNENRYENDSHSAFFLETKKIPISEDFAKFTIRLIILKWRASSI
jgi:hypothetical protein